MNHKESDTHHRNCWGSHYRHAIVGVSLEVLGSVARRQLWWRLRNTELVACLGVEAGGCGTIEPFDAPPFNYLHSCGSCITISSKYHSSVRCDAREHSSDKSLCFVSRNRRCKLGNFSTEESNRHILGTADLQVLATSAVYCLH